MAEIIDAKKQEWLEQKRKNEHSIMALPVEIPADEKAEQALIGCCVLGAYEQVLDEGGSIDLFHHELTRKAWKALEKLSDASLAINEVNVAQEVGGGPMWLMSAIEQAPTSENYKYWMPKLKDMEVRRRVFLRYYDGITKVNDDTIPTPDILADMEKNFFDVTTNASTLRSQREGWSEVLDDMGEAWPNGKPNKGIPTGMPSIDRLLQMEPGSMNTLAARPGRGKTSFAIYLAVQAALRGKKVVYWSFEMPFNQIAAKVISASSGLDVRRYLETGDVPGGIEKMVEATKAAMALPITIEDNVGLTVSAIRAQARRLVKEKDIDFFIVDYIQLIHSGKRYDSRVNEVGFISRQLKCAAMETEKPFLVLSQLNRQIETRGPDAEPRLADLRESGSIEQDSDMVAFLHQPDIEGAPDFTNLIVRKNRHGPEGKAGLQWTKYNGVFEPLEKEVTVDKPIF